MRIACPSCAATYEVPAFRLKPGKLVRCARCHTDWLPEPEIAESEPPPGSSPEPPPGSPPLAPPSSALPDVALEQFSATLPEVTAMDLAATATPRPARPELLTGAWVLSVLLLAGAVAATFGWRDALVRAWPPIGHVLSAAEPPPAPIAGKKPE